MDRQCAPASLETCEEALDSGSASFPDVEAIEAASRLREQLVHELFEEQAQRTPHAIAVEYQGEILTYEQLNKKANQLARYLLNEGIEPDDLVGVCLARSLEMVVGVMAILKAGAAYLPLDPNYPPERLQYMLADASPRAVLTHEELRALLPAAPMQLIVLGTKLKEISAYVDEDLPPLQLGLTAQNLVYCIYTSGSTGRPKGTAMAHRSMVNLIEWHRRTFGTGVRRVLQFAALSFDVAFQEIFSTLCTGSTLVLLGEWLRKDARALTDFLIQSSIQRLFVPPMMLQGLAESCRATHQVPRSLQDVITAGEQLRITPAISALFGQIPGCRLHNHYGPTEAHVVTALTLPLDCAQWPSLPAIGSPISNIQIHILDEALHRLEVGSVGEIYIGGAGLARGYLRRPEMTAQRFVADPFSGDPRARLYKTGDLGRMRADGVVEYLGRNDDQVKIRGYRIELGEIEAHLARYERVGEVAVLAREDVPGEKRLAAYVVPAGPAPLDLEKMRSYLRAKVPDYMVPSAFVLLDVLPLTPNGKLDRRALPAPSRDAYASQQYEAPRTPSETLLASIWRELIGIEQVGRSDDFFELGGHSLLIVHMLERLRQAGWNADVSTVYASPRLADLASRLTPGAATPFVVPPNGIPEGCSAITPDMLPLVQLDLQQIEHIAAAVPAGMANIQDIYPLAPLQEGLLFHHKLDEHGGDTYVVPVLLSFSSRERLDRFILALQHVVDRHDILRTAVLWERLPRPVQVVYRHVEVPVEEIDPIPDRALKAQLRELMEPQAQRLDLRRAPLMRLRVIPDVDGLEWYGVFQLHHFAGDHESVEAMFAEIMAHLDGRAHDLPPAVAYRNHVAQAIAIAQAQTECAERFFRSKLEDVEAPTMPFGLLDALGDSTRKQHGRRVLDAPLSRRIRSEARRAGVSPATLFHAAWALVMAGTSGRDDPVFGTVLLGRLQGNVGTQRVLGMFINTLPIHIRLRGASARELVAQTQRELAELLNHEQTSLPVAQRCSAIGGATPLFSALLNYRHITLPIETGQPRLAPGIQILACEEWTNYPLAVSIDDHKDDFVLTVHSVSRANPHRVMSYLLTGMQSLLEALQSSPDTLASRLSILPAQERREVSDAFNQTDSPYPREALIQEIFEEQVALRAEEVAVIYEGAALTFGQLNARANQLAWHLRARGVRADDLVGLAVDRSLDMLVGILGILKAGGAYVPLDPNYPAERLRYMLKDASPKLALIQEHVRPLLQSTGVPLIALDEEWVAIAANSTSNPDSRSWGLRADHLAYVIYTSGTTGQAKGVTIEHRSVVNLWQGLHAIYCLSRPCTRVAVNASFNFDASIKQIVQILSGRTIVLVPQEVRADAATLMRFMEENRIDAIDATPSQLRTWLEAGLIDEGGDRPRIVLVGGEPIGPELWARLGRCPQIDFYNVYGPTECTVDVTWARVRDHLDAPCIGPPMQNKRVYILDPHGEPVPIGVFGEIYVGGVGLARGYLNRPEITAERFLPDPFSPEPSARMYKTGDLGAWRADGAIEYAGRNDNQVKVRGYRIELGEIEAQLLQHACVREAVVLAREDEPGEKRIVAYVVLDAPHSHAAGVDSGQALTEAIDQWKIVHEDTYSAAPVGPSFVGWSSSYTGQPIPAAQMHEWLDNTLHRIQALKPTRVLEIGCGVGLLLQHLAPACAVYVGADFSSTGLRQLQRWMLERPELKHVQLLHRSATELQDLEAGTFDTVVLNSVVQYFPHVEYLIEVLEGAVRLLRPGGRIFLGDLRHLGLLPTFHSVVQLGKAAATVNVGQLRKRIARAVAQDKELVLDPQLFEALCARIPAVGKVETRLKRGLAPNELTRYRYDVVLHLGERSDIAFARESLEWGRDIGSLAELEAGLSAQRWDRVELTSVPNGRLARELAAQQMIATSEEHVTASVLRRQLNERHFDNVEPEQFWRIADAHGYDVAVTWGSRSCEYIDVQFVNRAATEGDSAGRGAHAPPVHSPAHQDWSAYATNPLESTLRQQLVPKLREHLKARLPDYMLPSAWMLLKHVPLTPNGKVDRRALPAPQSRPEELGEYVAPRNEMEKMLTELWAQILRVDRVGVQDNFFELGGHSLLATRVITHISHVLDVDLPLRVTFEQPTIEGLCNCIVREIAAEVSTEGP